MSNSNYTDRANKPTENIPMALEGFVSKLPMGYRDVYRDRREIANYNQDGSYFHALTEKEVLDKIFEKALELGLPIALEKSFRDNSDIYKGWQKNRKKNRLKGSIKDVKPSGEVSEDLKNQEPPEVELRPNIHPLIEEHIKSLQEAGCIVAALDVEKKSIVVINPDPDVRAAYRQALNPFQPQGAAYEGIEELSVKYGEYLIQGSFENVKVYNPILPGKPRKIEFDVASTVNSSPMHLGPSTEKDMLSALNQLGLVPDKKNGPENLTIVINAYIQSQKAEICQGFDTPGFYKNPGDNGITVIGYGMRTISNEELRDALRNLNAVAGLFPSASMPRVSASVKWGLTAPFGFYMRQRRIYPKGILLYGPSGTSKTAIMTISHGLWGLWDGDRNHGFFSSGSQANTEARMGKELETGTFPIIFDEGDSLYLRTDNHENTAVIAILKHAMQGTVSRETFDKGISQALATVAITANKKPPAGAEPLLNRLDTFESSKKEEIKASPREKDRFKEMQNSLYSQIEAIGQWVAHKVIGNPDILTSDYASLGEELLSEMYREAGMDIPDWVFLRAQVTGIEDVDVDIREQVRSYVVKSNLEAFSRSYGRVGILAENSRGEPYPQYDSMTNVSAEEAVTHSIKGGRVPWQKYKNTTGIEQVILTTAFAKDISRIVGEAYNLQSIGELLGFEYKVSWIGNKASRTLVVSLDDYLKFLDLEIEDQAPDRTLQDKEGEIWGKSRSLNPKNPELPENASTEEKKARVEAPGESTTLDEKKEKIERPWKTREESMTAAVPEESKDKTDTKSHEDPSGTEKGENAMDPILRLLIDCTYNSSKKFKTVTELWNSCTDPNLSQKELYASLEELVKNGKAVKQETKYASKEVLEGKA